MLQNLDEALLRLVFEEQDAVLRFFVEGSVSDEVEDQNGVLAIQTIAFRRDWDVIQRSLYAYREIFIDGVKRLLAGDCSALEDLDPEFASLPQSFLTYVTEGQPGHSLLNVDPLDEYIYSGETTHSTLGPAFLDLIRDVARLKRDLRVPGTSEKEIPVPTFHTRIREIYDRLQRYATSLPGPYGSLALRSLDEFARTLQQPGTTLDRQELEALARQTMEHLMGLYQTARVGATDA